jgi:hypothetical protein
LQVIEGLLLMTLGKLKVTQLVYVDIPLREDGCCFYFSGFG